MKQTSWKFLPAVFMAVLLFIPSVFAADLAAPGTPARKLQRGFLNIALSPMEISTQMARHKKEEHVLPTWITAAGLGSVLMVGRALTGVYDIVTAPVPFPKEYGSLVDPELPWQYFEETKAPAK
jgi:putative exosortase-associated protein (TIGR04073 family)